MAKWPAYGRCKSRLSKDIGKNYALNIQKNLLIHTVSVSKFLEREGYLDISLATNGIGFKSSKRWSEQLGLNKFNLQGSGTLGEKMRRQIILNNRFFSNSRKRDFLIIGCDLPDLSHLDLLEAITKIRKNDIIFQGVGETIINKYYYGEQDVELEDVVAELLVSNKMTIATAESCTGGLIGDRLTNVSGSSKYYKGGVVAYSNEIKSSQLHVNQNTKSGKQHNAG